MFNSIEAFFKAWEKESGATQRILDVLTDDSLNQKISSNDRTLGRIAWHITVTIPEMISRTGLAFENFNENSPVLDSAKEIADYYREVSNKMVSQIKQEWNDETLREEREMYGERWTVGATLNSLVFHQIHHRGQITVLMRQAGLEVPGIYGPSREEWSQFGMKAPEV